MQQECLCGICLYKDLGCRVPNSRLRNSFRFRGGIWGRWSLGRGGSDKRLATLIWELQDFLLLTGKLQPPSKWLTNEKGLMHLLGEEIGSIATLLRGFISLNIAMPKQRMDRWLDATGKDYNCVWGKCKHNVPLSGSCSLCRKCQPSPPQVFTSHTENIGLYPTIHTLSCLLLQTIVPPEALKYTWSTEIYIQWRKTCWEWYRGP